jgi:signal transduction histidine kinase
VNLQRLKWIAILAPIGFIGVLEYARFALAPIHAAWQGRLLMNGVVLLGAVFFYGAVFTVVDQMQQELERRNRELASLRSAGLDVTSELSLDVVLEKIVDHARRLIDARYGALAVYDDKHAIKSFITSGVAAELETGIGAPPVGRGLLGAVLRDGQRLRVPSIADDPRFGGFPAGHPPMRSLLAVPVVCRSPFVGNLYLSEKEGGGDFTEEDEETLVRFAAQASIAVDNAHLHAQVGSLAVAEERLRLAREMHDGQAQVLAYVNTKAQAVQAFLDAGRPAEASEQLRQLAAAAREVYADVREGILGLRTVVDSENGLVGALSKHLQRWQDGSGIHVDFVEHEVPPLATDVELQLLRIIQEALANVRKHSAAKQARVELRGYAKGVRVLVADDGVGFDPEARVRGGMPRFGLATMRERCQAIGAGFALESEPGAGTRVEIEYQGPP